MIETFLALNPIVKAVLILVTAVFAFFTARVGIFLIVVIATVLLDRFW